MKERLFIGQQLDIKMTFKQIEEVLIKESEKLMDVGVSATEVNKEIDSMFQSVKSKLLIKKLKK